MDEKITSKMLSRRKAFSVLVAALASQCQPWR